MAYNLTIACWHKNQFFGSTHVRSAWTPEYKKTCGRHIHAMACLPTGHLSRTDDDSGGWFEQWCIDKGQLWKAKEGNRKTTTQQQVISWGVATPRRAEWHVFSHGMEDIPTFYPRTCRDALHIQVSKPAWQRSPALGNLLAIDGHQTPFA
ncbi:hypothetical protein ANO14919_039700 [Xylariales sp. No.14919]|nr:hypothetical protein ANO14919_039700 [Xylariales sp. No.14919]